MSRKIKRASILAVIIYIMINSLVWGLMKAYINSYNKVNREKLVMAQISDSPDGKEISVMGNSFRIAPEKSGAAEVLKPFLPVKVRAVAEIFRLSGQEIVQKVLK